MTTKIESLKDLYVDHLKDMYSAETQITKALPKVINENHLNEEKAADEKLTKVAMNVVNQDALQESMEAERV
ncbi:MAG: DUF892 family protein [Anaerolineales bacterium]|nr:DUF892 family protein [Anaerolineales bacterium]